MPGGGKQTENWLFIGMGGAAVTNVQFGKVPQESQCWWHTPARRALSICHGGCGLCSMW